MNQHLLRLVEARLHYFASVGAALAERHLNRPNCLADAVLAHWPRIREIAHAAKTDEQLRYAAKLLKYAGATADGLLEGNSDTACWTLQALRETLEESIGYGKA